ncbi:MAG: GNAT family N-acetyltransferase [Pseudomonadota bacterium]
MKASSSQVLSDLRPHTSIEILDTLSTADLYDLCDATDAAIEAGGGGFGWVTPPAREVLERYWRGVMTVPERHLLVARMDGMICGAAQLVEPGRHNESQSFATTLLACFIAPWARGRGAGRKLMETSEKLALEMGYKVIQLDVRETQETAIHLYETMGYKCWGINPTYALIDRQIIAGRFFIKTIGPLVALQEV